mgnify:CR=1 FL=1
MSTSPKKSSIHDGELLGHGSYGCAFKPAIKCEKGTIDFIDNNLVKYAKIKNTAGKIFFPNEPTLFSDKDLISIQRSVNIEWENAKRMKKIDPEQESILYPFKKCDIKFK